MNRSQLIQSLQTVKDKLNKVLDSDASRVLEEAIGSLQVTVAVPPIHKKKKSLIPSEWGYSIREQPLRFRPSLHNGYTVQADIICNILWQDENSPPINQELVLRIWSCDPKLTFREEFDALALKDKIQPSDGRVLLRYHFDLANLDQPGPKYHIQCGGKSEENELCWFPKFIDLPRLVYQPMDLILLCQLVVANFFPDQYETIFRDPIMRGVVRNVEQKLLKDYYQQCLKVLERGDMTLLDHLWNNRE